eukprot:1758701-Pleurochrysis_carterae.AAC.1
MKIPDTTISSGFSEVLVTASCIGIVADSPAAAWLRGFNQSVAPDVLSQSAVCASSTRQSRPTHFCRGPALALRFGKLRTAEQIDALRKRCAQMLATAAADEMQKHGIRTCDHAFMDVPFFDPTWAPMGVMHVEFEGNVK